MENAVSSISPTSTKECIFDKEICVLNESICVLSDEITTLRNRLDRFSIPANPEEAPGKEEQKVPAGLVPIREFSGTIKHLIHELRDIRDCLVI